jgi:hypothetical protein
MGLPELQELANKVGIGYRNLDLEGLRAKLQFEAH